MNRNPEIPLRVNDLKQFAYCPRIVFYSHVMPLKPEATYKMKRGKIDQERIEKLESRRKFKKYGLEKARRQFHVRLFSSKLNLSGTLDMVLETPAGAIPVDFKMSNQDVFPNHHFQLAGYALLLEENFAEPVDVGFIYLIMRNDGVPVSITQELKARTLNMLEEIRRMIENRLLPDPTPYRARCTDCEFRNYCGDVF